MKNRGHDVGHFEVTWWFLTVHSAPVVASILFIICKNRDEDVRHNLPNFQISPPWGFPAMATETRNYRYTWRKIEVALYTLLWSNASAWWWHPLILGRWQVALSCHHSASTYSFASIYGCWRHRARFVWWRPVVLGRQLAWTLGRAECCQRIDGRRFHAAWGCLPVAWYRW